MNTVYVAFQFDTEDFITPRADDVLLELADILDEHNVKASFCIVGEKARVLERRGRRDVIDALKKHDTAYQSNVHSVHPVISENLAEEDWDAGVKKVIEQEAQGLSDLTRIFGTEASAFIQPGGSWAPQTPYAYERMGGLVYVDGIFEADPVWFCGSLCLRAAMHFPEHSTLADLDILRSKFDDLWNARRDGGLITIVLHPCMFVTEEFWDTVNFAYGVNPPEGNLVPAPLRPVSHARESLEAFDRFVGFILEHPNVRVVTLREVPNLYREPRERKLSLGQTFALAEEACKRNDWQIVDGISVSPAEMLRLFVDLLVDYLHEGVEPRFIHVRSILGPTSPPQGTQPGSRTSVSLKDLIDLCRSAKRFMSRQGRMPPTLANPGELLEGAARAITFYSKHGCLPERVEIAGLSSLPEVVYRWDLSGRVRRQWKWPIFQNGFESKRIEELTLWQSWTMRPAVFTG